MKLPCVSIGPRSGGRDYGLLARFRDLRIPDSASAVLSDFALALLQWGRTPGRDFSLFFELNRERSHFLIAQAAYLRGERLGPVVIANGFVLDAASLEAANWQPHRLLPVIRSPREGPWEIVETDAELEIRQPRDPTSALSNIGRALPQLEGQSAIFVGDEYPIEEALAETMDGAYNLPDLLLTWATTSELPKVERFDPSKFDLILSASTEAKGSPRFAWQLNAGGLSGPVPPVSRAWRIWQVLFLDTLSDDRQLLKIAAPFAPRAETADAKASALQSMNAVLAHVGLERAWPMIERWAKSAAALDGAPGVAAEESVVMLIGELLNKQESKASKVATLRSYLHQVAPLLPRAPAMMPAGLAAEHGLIDGLDDADLELLIAPGLSRAVANALRKQEIERKDVSPSRIRIISEALMRRMRQTEPSAEILQLATAVVSGAVNVIQQHPDSGRALGDLTIELADQTLVLLEEWRDFAPVVAQAILVSPQSDVRKLMLERLSKAIGYFWRLPNNPDARRRSMVVLYLTRGKAFGA